jgi:predicted transcriptional regulator of viral defense system
VVQIWQGLHTLAVPYQKYPPHSDVIANHLVRGFYVRLQMALSHYALIPENVAVVTNVTTGQLGTLRSFSYQRIQPALFFEFIYQQVTVTQWIYMATPEKSLLDLIYLTSGADSEAYIHALRLQNLDKLDTMRLTEYVERINRAKLRRVLKPILQVVQRI